MPELHPQIQHVLRVMAEMNLQPIEAMTPGRGTRANGGDGAARRRAAPVDRSRSG